MQIRDIYVHFLSVVDPFTQYDRQKVFDLTYTLLRIDKGTLFEC